MIVPHNGCERGQAMREQSHHSGTDYFAWDEFQNLGGNERIVEHHVGLAKGAQCAQR
jgi:hypothetical protein